MEGLRGQSRPQTGQVLAAQAPHIPSMTRPRPVGETSGRGTHTESPRGERGGRHKAKITDLHKGEKRMLLRVTLHDSRDCLNRRPFVARFGPHLWPEGVSCVGGQAVVSCPTSIKYGPLLTWPLPSA